MSIKIVIPIGKKERNLAGLRGGSGRVGPVEGGTMWLGSGVLMEQIIGVPFLSVCWR